MICGQRVSENKGPVLYQGIWDHIIGNKVEHTGSVL